MTLLRFQADAAACPSRRHGTVAGLAVLFLALAGCGDVEREPEAPEISRARVSDLPGLRRASAQISYGARPRAPTGFAKLVEKGFDTIICVEAAEPDVEGAASFDLKTYHVPIGFGAPSSEACLAIAAAAHASENAVYVYCADGRARAPGAAVIARKSLEGLSLDGVLRALQEAGVGSSHAGLQQAAIRFTPPSEEVRTHALGTIPSRVPPSGAAKSMVEVSDRWSRLNEWAANGWKRPRPPGATLGGSPPAPARYSDLEVADQAAALSAVFERLPEPDAPYDKPTVFRRLRSDAQVAARLLEVGLRRGEPDRAESGRARLEQTCIQCHRAYRD